MDAPLQPLSQVRKIKSVSVSREWTPLYSVIGGQVSQGFVSVSREWTPLYSFRDSFLPRKEFPSAVNGRPSTADPT